MYVRALQVTDYVTLTFGDRFFFFMTAEQDDSRQGAGGADIFYKVFSIFVL